MTSTTLPRFKLTPDIAAWRGGAGPSLVLIHGVGLNGDAWYAMLPELVSRFTVTVVDMPGHGESDPIRDVKQPTLDDFTSRIADALELCDGPSVVVGHSMGALIAMQLAVQVPDLVSGAVPLNSIFRRTNAAATAVQSRAMEIGKATQVDHSETLARWFAQNPEGAMQIAANRCDDMLRSTPIPAYAAAYSVFAHSDGPTDQALRETAVPMLFMTGENEPNSTPAMSHSLAQLAPNSQSVIIDGARHMMPMSHADEVNQHIISFIQNKVFSDG